ncbi:TRAP transporter large permease [Limimaricola cinnabarinus]|nr:TRAP transporter large permease subunit [Limimaricola cinnabarinus]
MNEAASFIMLPVLLLVILAGFPVAFSLISVAFAFGLYTLGDGVIVQLLSKIEDTATNSVLAAVPLFIFMGVMLERSGIADRLFEAVHLWTRRLPGGLAVGAIGLGTIFAAASGVVGATETVIGMLAIPVMMRHNYDKRLLSGTICAGGSLGTVIPPSITVIVLGPVASVSVGDLFAGLLAPGLIMALLFVAYVMTIATLNPSLAPREPPAPDEPNLLEKLKITAIALIPPILLIFTVLGTILMGLATPTEAAACGALGTIILAAIYRRISIGVLWTAMSHSAGITAMILLIVLGGSMFAGVFFAAGGMMAIQSMLSSSGLEGWQALCIILGLAFVLGFMMDLISVILIIIPIAMPIVLLFGYDPVWFCIAFLVVLQTSYLTPPMAPSIFYLRAIAPPEIRLGDMYVGVLPFIAVQLLTLALILAFPQIALWFPGVLSGPKW